MKVNHNYCISFQNTNKKKTSLQLGKRVIFFNLKFWQDSGKQRTTKCRVEPMEIGSK